MLDVDIVFAPDKVLRRWQGSHTSLSGYEIHHGRVARCAEVAWFEVDGYPQGYRRGQVFGTHWHGLFDNDDFRRLWLTDAAAAAGRDGFVVADDIDVSARRDGQLDLWPICWTPTSTSTPSPRCWTMARRRVRPLSPPCADSDRLSIQKRDQPRVFAKTVPYCRSRRPKTTRQFHVARTFPTATVLTNRAKTARARANWL